MIHRPPTLPLFPYTTLFRSYTQRATRITQGDLVNKPTRVKSLLEFEALFGAAPTLAIDEVVIDEAGNFLGDRKSTRLNSSHLGISYAVFCLKKKKKKDTKHTRKEETHKKLNQHRKTTITEHSKYTKVQQQQTTTHEGRKNRVQSSSITQCKD